MIRIFLGNQAYVLFLMPLFVVGYLFLNLNTSYFEITEEFDLGFWGSISELVGNFLPGSAGFLY